MRFYAALLLLLCASTAKAQLSVPATQGGAMPDSLMRFYHSLPPSITAELRRSQKNRALAFHDTVRAADIAREHFNDSASTEYSDSAISLYDTAVSLPHKEWLDSEMVEIPELVRFGNHIHFNYPPAIMTEADLRPVPFDSTLVEHMNPVTRENLPFFDQSPIPMPLRPARKSESFLEAGAGNLELPRVAGWLAQSFSERSVFNAFGEYRAMNAAQSAIHNYANILASLATQFGEDPAIEAFHSQDLNVQAGYSLKSVATTNISSSDHTISQLSGEASLAGDLSEGFHYDARVENHECDGLSSDTKESSQDAMLGMRFDVSSLRFIAEGNYSRSSQTLDTSVTGANFFGSINIPINAESAKALIGERKSGAIEWYAGGEYLGGSGADGTSYSAFLPVARVRFPLNARWELGGSFEPQVRLASLRALMDVNPFYLPELVLQFKRSRGSVQAPIDGRSVVMDKINLAAFMNYILSPDDELRFEARLVTRTGEPVFDAVTMKDSAILFTVTPMDTRRIQLTASGNFLLFMRDVITGSAEFTSATIEGEGQAIPFEPNFKLTAEYHFNSIWDNVRPSVAFRAISRPDRTLTFLDVNVQAEITRSIGLSVSVENMIDGPSDFWPGFPEKPRSIWATVRYVF